MTNTRLGVLPASQLGPTVAEQWHRWRRGALLAREVAVGQVRAFDIVDAHANNDLTAGERAVLDFLVEAAVLRLASGTR